MSVTQYILALHLILALYECFIYEIELFTPQRHLHLITFQLSPHIQHIYLGLCCKVCLVFALFYCISVHFCIVCGTNSV